MRDVPIPAPPGPPPEGPMGTRLAWAPWARAWQVWCAPCEACDLVRPIVWPLGKLCVACTAVEAVRVDERAAVEQRVDAAIRRALVDRSGDIPGV
jgi:hypothetical protein